MIRASDEAARKIAAAVYSLPGGQLLAPEYAERMVVAIRDLWAAGYRLAGPGEVVVSRGELVDGIIVGVGGEHDPVPPQEHVDRAADLIMRAAARRRPIPGGVA